MRRFSRALAAPLLLVGFVAFAEPAGIADAAGSVSLTAFGSTYGENFNALAASGIANTDVPNGWHFAETGTNANTTYRAGTGSDTNGDTYSFGATGENERAFGGLRSGSLVPLIGAQFVNNTSGAITSLQIDYTGEQWRLGQNTTGRAADRLDFQLSTTATSLSTGTWTDFDLLDFQSPVVAGTVGALVGNVAPNRTAVSSLIGGLSIPSGATFWVRWADTDLIPGSDDGLSVDDFFLTPFGAPTVPNLSINDVSANEGTGGPTSFDFTVSLSSAAGAGGVTFDIGTADGTASAVSGDYVANTLTGQTIPEGSSSYTFSVVVNGDAAVEPDEMFLVNVTNVTGATVTDGQGQGTIQTDDFPLVAIHDIQGAAHLSPHAGERVQTTPGVVTAVRRGSGLGFYIQDVAPDDDVETSEGLFVFTSSAPTVSVGDTVQVVGTVTEFGTSPNLTLTELTSPVVTVLPDDNPLPSATVIGAGGRVPPTTVIDNDSPTRIDITTAGSFDADEDGVDFYESLEGMLVQVNDVTASGPTSNFGSNSEIPVVDAAAGVDTPRGGVIIRPTDFNPERLILNDWILGGPRLPDVHVGASIAGATVGVIDYSFSNFKLQVTSLGVVTSTLTREVADAPEPGELAVASFNVENLAPGDPQAKFDELADLIIDNLRAPDLIAVEEIQDNNGTGGGGGVAANLTYAKLIETIKTAGGPTYEFRQIDPVDGQDGGAPGGNIRQGFLFRTDRGLSFVDRPGGGSTTAVTVEDGPTGPQLSASPGRIDPTNPAFTASRKPLAGEFRYGGRTLFIVANHFNSKGGDEPLFGRFQPPNLVTEAQRIQQATVVANFVDSVEALDPTAGVIVLGDLNDFEFSAPMAVLKAAGLKPLIETLPAAERYTYVFQGNSQSLDHIMMNAPLLSRPFDYDSVHVNAEFADQASDHDPQLVLVQPVFDFDGFFSPVDNSPTANIVKAGQAIPVRFSLDGDQGLNVIAAGYPTSNQVPCGGGTGDPVEETDTSGSSGLHYDAATDEYTYVWKTQKSWAGTCRVLTVKLSDGTIHEALFQFTR